MAKRRDIVAKKKAAKKKTSSKTNKDVKISIKAPNCLYVLYSVNVIKKTMILTSDKKDNSVTKSLKKKYHNQFVLTVSGKKGASVVIDAGKARKAIRYKFSNTETIDIPFGICI